MSNRKALGATVGVTFALLLASSIAEAQWVMLARHAIGRVEQMSQQAQSSSSASYDTAAVMLEAPADKVYAAVLRGVSNAPGIRITSQDGGQRVVKFTNGQQVAGVKVSPLSDELTHMLITSAHVGTEQDAARLVMNSVLRVCKELNVMCSQAAQ